jgi:hypothetical protein
MGKWITRVMYSYIIFYVVDYRPMPSIMSMN